MNKCRHDDKNGLNWPNNVQNHTKYIPVAIAGDSTAVMYIDNKLYFYSTILRNVFRPHGWVSESQNGIPNNKSGLNSPKTFKIT